MFDDARADWAPSRALLRESLSPTEWDAAARTTINAHYTDPRIARQMWTALTRLEVEGGRVLEPGCGAGAFIGLAPADVEVTGVELDPMTATIASLLYPDATVRAESFADSRLPEGTFDAVIGNVPFSDVVLHDPVHNASRLSMHNYFIVKSLHLVRPGGLVALLTSRYTMDAQNPAARREMAALADLVAAVRLPTGAHRRTAGTDVITDLLLLRRRGTEAPADVGWDTVDAVTINGRRTVINRYFTDHPDRVLGALDIHQGRYGDTLVVTADLAHLDQDLGRVLDGVVADARARGVRLGAIRTQPVSATAPTAAPGEAWHGSIVRADDSTFGQVADGVVEPLSVPKSAARELTALLELRDRATRLLRLESGTTDDTSEITAARTDLHAAYLQYTSAWGPLNRYSLRPTGRTNDTGDTTFARIVPTAPRLLRADPFGPLVFALERFDDTDQTATPAAIMSRRVIAPRPEVRGVDTPADAVAVSLDRTGRIDLSVIADLLGASESDARAALAGLVYEDPETHDLVHAPEYLSGDVRSKLDAARDRAADEPAFAENVRALSEVLPEDLGVEDVTPRLGAVWISAEVHQQFLRDLLGTDDVRVENLLPGMWDVRGGRAGLRSTSEWGTLRRPAPDIAQAVIEQRAVLVHDDVEDLDGRVRRVLNPVETAAAQEKADALQERFADWVWEDPARARALVTEYNRRFNSIVLRDYTDAGAYLSLPGVAATFTPRPHQRAAVARMIAEPAAGLFHEVGAGKTAEMVIGAMEMRRMGLVTKPVVVVPNHMLEQFSREWLQIYPQARVLAASSNDLTADRRRLFVGRMAANDWDAVIMTQGAFARIPLRAETQTAYVQAQVDRLRIVLHEAQGADRMSVKRVERKLLALENKIKDRTDLERDAGVCFEDTGIDYVVVDEMHMYKNLATESNIRDASIDGSERASDLHMKLEYLRSRGRERVVTGATATPIANSVTEAFVMQRYLRPDLLERAGIGAFDAWAATFGQTVTQMEMAPTGSTSFRMKTRFAKFTNVPEMLKLWSTFADVKTAGDLDLPTPELELRPDGTRAPVTVAIPPTVELERFVEDLGERADAVARQAVRPDEDNMLTISTDGRKAALDIRMVLPQDPTGPTKLDTAADAISRVWASTRDNEYLDVTTGAPSLVRGALQLVFSDIGTPNPDRWNAYDELHLQLVRRGLPADSIRFMHEAKTDVDKARLFAAARAGHVAVLIGSTAKMGVGTNVQARAIALYHLDCPWRPSDIAQREGRILRQGNQNPQVAIVRFVTEGSFDAYMWQGVERKATFIAQLMRGRLDTREIEEIDSAALSAAEAKAISSGNPLLLEHSVLQNEVTRLRRLERAHQRNEQMLLHTRDDAQDRSRLATSDVAALEAALPRVVDTGGNGFHMQIRGRDLDTRADAGRALAAWAGEIGLRWAARHSHRDYRGIGRISGFPIDVALRAGVAGPEVHVELSGVPRSRFVLSRDAFLDGGVGTIARIENRVSGIRELLAAARLDLERSTALLDETTSRIGRPFTHTLALGQAEHELARLEKKLSVTSDGPHREGVGASPQVPGSSRSNTPLDPFRRSRSGAGRTAASLGL